jgi:hypothetical protein
LENYQQKSKHGGPRPNSGRPRGVRNKLTREANATLTQLCQAHTEEMVRVLVEVARSKKASPAARAVAAQAVLDRGNGKPMQSHEIGGPEGSPIPIAPVINLYGKPDHLPDDGQPFMTRRLPRRRPS